MVVRGVLPSCPSRIMSILGAGAGSLILSPAVALGSSPLAVDGFLARRLHSQLELLRLRCSRSEWPEEEREMPPEKVRLFGEGEGTGVGE